MLKQPIIILSTLFIFLFLSGCSTGKTRRPIYKSEVVFSSGNFEDKSWDDSLKFKRFSWFKDATLTHEILISSLTTKSAFSSWMGTDKLHLSRCSDFKIALIYSDINYSQGTSFLISELKKSGLKDVSLLDFSHQLKAHQNFGDWKLLRHKIIGLCNEGTVSKKIDVSIPGFQKTLLN
jgi:hypothetical protein